MILHCRLCRDPLQAFRDGWAHWPGLGGSCPGPRPEPDLDELPELAACEGCGAELHWTLEKALASGERALVMAGPDGAWVCPSTGDEHAPPF